MNDEEKFMEVAEAFAELIVAAEVHSTRRSALNRARAGLKLLVGIRHGDTLIQAAREAYDRRR